MHYGKKWLWGDNSVNIQGRVLVHCNSFLSLPSIYKPSLFKSQQ